MTTGENWDALMWECMVLTNCIEITMNFNVTLPGSNSSIFVWSGTYLDTVDNADLLSVLPNDAQVSSLWF